MSRLRLGYALSHCLPEDVHRCIKVSIRGISIHLCARCVGLYPALSAGLLARLGFTSEDTLPLPEWADLTIRLIIPFVGAAAWCFEQVGYNFSKALRVISGVFLGLGLGWVMGLHFRSPWPTELVELSIALGLVLMLGMLGRWTRLTEEAEELEAELPGVGKKTDDPDENEVDPKAS